MNSNKKRKVKSMYTNFLWSFVITIGIVTIVTAIYLVRFSEKQRKWISPEELLISYMDHIPKREYKEMYAMLAIEASGNISQEDFIKRNSSIYEGIEIDNMTVKVLAFNEKENTVTYQTSFDTVAGKIHFKNQASFLKGENGYQLVWDDNLIFPQLGSADKVRVSTIQAKRGRILDRNGQVLAGAGTVSSVGIVPGELEDKKNSIQKIATLLDIEPEVIEKKLAAKWVKNDSFVPIKIIPKVEERELLPLEIDKELQKEQKRQEKLLLIPGVRLTDREVRTYPLKEAAAHLIGELKTVTAEDLEEHEGEGYTANSVIGKSGMEGLFEKQLKGKDGCRIYIVDANGREKEELAYVMVQHGEDIKLTIDAKLQTYLHEQFKEDKGCSVAMNPYTGEVLALVSTPSYDNNAFIMGMSNQQWNALNNDERKPLYNRFRQVWCPGSTFKPITAAIGLKTGAIDPTKNYGQEGLRWQKDQSWGSYYVTTLHTYSPVILENALIYSDNIYFAKAALRIGADRMEQSLRALGFHKELPFDIKMHPSQFSNTKKIKTEVQLADSGYGQGQVLVNPLHLASIYTAFCNKGNIIKPYLRYGQKTEDWISGVFSENVAAQVLDGLKKVVKDRRGTGYGAHRKDIVLAGKTGTAEIKASKEDTSGTELGWFAVFTAEEKQKHPILLVSMVEDVKGRGGSGYVVEKDKKVLEKWFRKQE